MKKYSIALVCLWSLTTLAEPKASFSATATFTQGWTPTLQFVPNGIINLTKNPITFTVPNGISITSANFAGARAKAITQNNTVTVTTGNAWWPDKPFSTDKPFTFSFGANSNQFSISNLKIGNTPVPVTTTALPVPAGTTSTSASKEFVIPLDVNPQPGYYLLDSEGNHTSLPFAPYVDVTQIQPISSLINDVNEAGLKGIRLAFITEGGSTSGLNWAGYTLDFLQDEVRYLQSKGIKVIISLGGATGVFPGANQGDLTTFHDYLEKIITTYPGVGLCFDIEGSNPLLGATAGTTNLMKATAEIQKKYKTPINITLAVLPTGLTDTGLAVVTAAQNAGLHFDINLMAMDYGGAFDGTGSSMKDYAITAALNTAKQADTSISHVQLTPMIGYNDDIAELFSLNDAQELATWAKKVNVALSMWSFTRDHPSSAGASKWASPSASGPGVQKNNYEFCKTFNQE